nr:nuclear transport factor 2 family protein [Mycobacterium sp. 1164966.3]
MAVADRSGSDRTVERYLQFLAAHDWDGLATTIADEGLTREGPFCDRIEGKQRYLAYLRKVLTELKDHRLDVQRVSHVDTRLSYVELTEAFEIDGAPAAWPECLLFERNDDGLITHVSVFFKQRGAEQGAPRRNAH